MREGEIVGLYGLIGAGRSEFVMGVYGRQRCNGGEIAWQGRKVDIRSERQAIDLGMALAPESRRDQGLCLNLGVGLNINLPVFDRLTEASPSRLAASGRPPTGRSPTCASRPPAATPSRSACRAATSRRS